MKKLLILFLAAAPLFSAAQERGSAEDLQSREERAREMQERKEAARKAQAQQGARPGAGMNMPTTMLYTEVVMTIRGGKQSVAFTMDSSVKEASSSRDAEELSKLSSGRYENLIAALNAAAKFDWQVVTSYEIETKEAREIHFVMAKEVPLTPEALRGRNQPTRDVSGRAGDARGGSGERARSRERR